MSVDRFRWRDLVASEHGPASTTRLVLLVLSQWMDRSGRAWPSTQMLAVSTGLSERAVCTHLEHAVAAGWITRRARGGGQGWKRHEYQAHIPNALIDVPLRGRKRTERGSARKGGEVLNEVQHDSRKGTERRSEGTEPHDRKALNEVQSNPSVNPTKNPITEVSSNKSTTASSDSIASHDGRAVVSHLHAELQRRGQVGIGSGRPWGAAVRCANAALRTWTPEQLTAAITWAMDNDHWRRKLAAEGAKVLKHVVADHLDGVRPANGKRPGSHVERVNATSNMETYSIFARSHNDEEDE